MWGSPAVGALVGRDAELAVLDSPAAVAAAGTGGVVLLSGEPGVGKTRLAREAAGRARDAVVSWGACRESEGAPPLWPWMQVLSWPRGETIAAGAADGPAARFQLFERIGHALRESAATAQRLHRQWGAGGLGHPLADLGQQARTAPLSQRELEVLTLLACGQGNSEIAAALGVSVHTIERHVANVFAKLSVTNRAGATAWAYRRGLVS